MTKRYRWTVLIIFACLLIWSSAIKGIICTFTHTPLAGEGHSSSEQGCISPSYDPPAIIFIDADGTHLDAKETQTMLDEKDYRDKDGNRLKINGAWGTKTIYAVNRYIGDCHGNSVMSLFEVK